MPCAPLGTVRDFRTLMWSSLNPEQHPLDQGGEGVNCAVVEPTGDSHAEQTLMLLGFAAPRARTYTRDVSFYDIAATDDWLVANDIQVSSLSMSRDTATRTPSAGEFMLMDELAYRWPCPLFCTPAGNGGSADEVNWQSYGALCAGSVKHRNLQAFAVDEFSSSRNPDPVLSLLSGATKAQSGDRELPEIVVPGSHPDEPLGQIDMTCLWGLDGTPLFCDSAGVPYICDYAWQKTFHGGGTSYSAPIANGIAARVISSRPALFAHKPDAIKMALMLTAHNVESGDWSVGTDMRDGTGVISAYDAVAYATTCTDLSGASVAPPATHGFCTGEADSGLAVREFRVLVPSSPPQNRHLRVALTWTSNPDFTTGQNALSDLDIGAFAADSGVYGSYSLDGSTEVFDVPRRHLTPSTFYTFRLVPQHIRIPSTARTNFFYYTLGWTWVQGQADTDVSVSRPQPTPDKGPASRARVFVRNHGSTVQIVLTGSHPPLSATVTDVRGRACIRFQVAALTTDTTLPIPGMQTLSAGTYMVILRSNDQSIISTVRVQKLD